MQSKYKVGLMRLNLWAAALLLIVLAYLSERLSSALLLVLASVWLMVTASLLEMSHRRPATVPWQLLPSLLLAGLLVADPERHALWLWVWPALLMLPQPGWVLALTCLLAGLTWWLLADLLGIEQTLFSGLVLLPLMLLGLARNRHLLPARSAARQRVRLVPGLPLWSGQQLITDLRRERARCRREGVHGELMLLRTSRRRLWPLAQDLCRLTHEFENCYRLDQRTLATLLLSRDDQQARERRQALLKGLRPSAKVRFASLSSLGSLEEMVERLEHQQHDIQVEPESVHG
ncbi:MAG: hypothetical protein LPK20_09010 [Halomonas sp.]|jgi:hypothetical protein|uniref:GGDEF domain-containing protein n=1 Tax=Billgrantia tianxiuensis TaxID=2497861 RepID=A0A6I6SS82_9GAMM|nr:MULTISPECIES: hypothetical protein [Halomonas]MCE8034730.1 hypothetical protein [Halomonas sp. MCCC 1A11057]MDX5433690.1 hypothetical protein [Halomonas sp.]QHC50580.1 hypothetical protein EKK97_14605 [Halomonas tianxiuensis]